MSKQTIIRNLLAKHKLHDQDGNGDEDEDEDESEEKKNYFKIHRKILNKKEKLLMF